MVGSTEILVVVIRPISNYSCDKIFNTELFQSRATDTQVAAAKCAALDPEDEVCTG